MVPSRDVLDRILGALGVDESVAREVRELLAGVVAAEDDEPTAVDVAEGMTVDEEVRSAQSVRSFQCVVLPAMLQSAEYARHVFQSAPRSTPEAVGRAVAAGVDRQSVLYEPGRESVFVVTETSTARWKLPGSRPLAVRRIAFVLSSLTLSSASSARGESRRMSRVQRRARLTSSGNPGQLSPQTRVRTRVGNW